MVTQAGPRGARVWAAMVVIGGAILVTGASPLPAVPEASLPAASLAAAPSASACASPDAAASSPAASIIVPLTLEAPSPDLSFVETLDCIQPSPLLTPAPTEPLPTDIAAMSLPQSPDGRHSDRLRLRLKRVITGANTPKSVESSQHGLFFVQNNIFRHTMTVYDRRFRKVKTIRDSIRLSDHGFPKFRKRVLGGPVEAAFTADGRYAWVTQRAMYGPGFPKPPPILGVCSPSDGYDRGFVYKVDTRSFKVVDVVRLGSLPKDLLLSPDGRLLLVSNWCSYDVSVVDLDTDREIRRIKVGQYPRGIAITPDSSTAYVAMLGGSRIATIDLRDFRVRYIPGVGGAPRDAILDPTGRYLYLTLSQGDGVVKLDLKRNRVVGRVHTGDDPRSMAIAPDGRSLYLVNYGSGTVSKVRTRDMRLLQTLRAGRHPVGITYDIETRQVWVSMYPGPLRVYVDR